jgi:hypothetical protein
MEEDLIRAYFTRQVNLVIERAAAEPEGFLSYFVEHYPKDEEILGLLAVSSMMSGDFHKGANFPTPVEALASLSGPSRTEICHAFREELKHRFRAMTAA